MARSGDYGGRRCESDALGGMPSETCPQAGDDGGSGWGGDRETTASFQLPSHLLPCTCTPVHTTQINRYCHKRSPHSMSAFVFTTAMLQYPKLVRPTRRDANPPSRVKRIHNQVGIFRERRPSSTINAASMHVKETLASFSTKSEPMP